MSACIELLEQPESTNRFRYQSELEKKSFSVLKGATSTNECATYPTIKINGIHSAIRVVVSVVSADSEHADHPYVLYNSNPKCSDPLAKFERGTCVLEFANQNGMPFIYSFKNLGILAVRQDEARLKLRESYKRTSKFQKGEMIFEESIRDDEFSKQELQDIDSRVTKALKHFDRSRIALKLEVRLINESEFFEDWNSISSIYSNPIANQKSKAGTPPDAILTYAPNAIYTLTPGQKMIIVFKGNVDPAHMSVVFATEDYVCYPASMSVVNGSAVEVIIPIPDIKKPSKGYFKVSKDCEESQPREFHFLFSEHEIESHKRKLSDAAVEEEPMSSKRRLKEKLLARTAPSVCPSPASSSSSASAMGRFYQAAPAAAGSGAFQVPKWTAVPQQFAQFTGTYSPSDQGIESQGSDSGGDLEMDAVSVHTNNSATPVSTSNSQPLTPVNEERRGTSAETWEQQIGERRAAAETSPHGRELNSGQEYTSVAAEVISGPSVVQHQRVTTVPGQKQQSAAPSPPTIRGTQGRVSPVAATVKPQSVHQPDKTIGETLDLITKVSMGLVFRMSHALAFGRSEAQILDEFFNRIPQLLTVRDKMGDSPVNNAILKEQPASAQRLIDMVRRLTPQHINTVNTSGHSPLMLVPHCRVPDSIATDLINAGASLILKDITQATAMHHAARTGRTGVLRILITQARNKHLELNSLLNDLDAYGYCPIHYAALIGSAETVRVLLESGANPNLTTGRNDEAALHLATIAGKVEVVQLLLESPKVEKNRLLKDGRSARCIAVEHENQELVRLMEEHGVVLAGGCFDDNDDANSDEGCFTICTESEPVEEDGIAEAESTSDLGSAESAMDAHESGASASVEGGDDEVVAINTMMRNLAVTDMTEEIRTLLTDHLSPKQIRDLVVRTPGVKPGIVTNFNTQRDDTIKTALLIFFKDALPHNLADLDENLRSIGCGYLANQIRSLAVGRQRSFRFQSQ